MQRTFKYRLYPNAEQREALFHIFGFCRSLYNSALEERINFYKSTGKSINYSTQCRYLPDIKKIFPTETSSIYSQTLQQTLKQLETAYKNFFGRVKRKASKAGFPRFKSVDRFRSFCFPQVSHDLSRGCVKLTNNKLKIFGVNSAITIIQHRKLEGIAKQCRIVKQGDQFYICITCDSVPAKPLAKTGKSIAIDLGLDSFITMDDGTKFHHPKPYKTSLDRLRYHQKKLAAKQPGSSNRKRQKSLVAKVYQKITNIREDFQHKLANQLVKKYDQIIIEELNIKSMLEAKGFEISKKNITDASWGKFIEKLTYKAGSADKLIVKVNPRNTSRMCSKCCNIKKSLSLSDRVYRCEACGFAMDRDQNAAINIRRLGTSLAIK